MAVIIRGKRKGERVIISQYCNDWVTADSEDGSRTDVFGITALTFTSEEMYNILTNDNPGTLFNEFEQVLFENRFRRKKRDRV